ncbi:hypothetical protein Pmani_014167 [Petrolisthes manimaculis]|uniref:BUD13 homolog n=1 Tax=Petrolisthes manimaculis TaxID=1843537 RepID=A0AAE1PUU8_9EUCA|nr:hypothetical protein Pmani_014167 [Petrolisthes manimaculis]
MKMAAPMSQKEYLRKYLSGSDSDKKKKKKRKKDKPPTQTPGMRIVEDSLDIKNVPYGYTDEDDNPTIAEITYEDEKLKLIEEFAKNKKWKKVQQGREGRDDDWLHVNSSDSDTLPQRISSSRRQGSGSPPAPRTMMKGDSSQVGPRKVRHDSESPPRKVRHDSESPPRRMRHDSGSPPRKVRYDSESPPRKMRRDSVSPPRRGRHDSDSPPRKVRYDSRSPPRQVRRSSVSPPMKVRHDSGSSAKGVRHNSGSIPRKSRFDSRSPQRKLQHSSPTRKEQSYSGSPPRKKRFDSGSPPLKNRHDSRSPMRNMRHDNSGSPLRRSRDTSRSPTRRTKKSSLSPSPDMRRKTTTDSSSSSQSKGKPRSQMNKHSSRSSSSSHGQNQPTPHITSPKRGRHDSGSPPPNKKQSCDSASSQKGLSQRKDSPQYSGRKRRETSPLSHNLDNVPSQPSRKDKDSDGLRLSSKRHDSNSSASSSPRRQDSDTSPPRKSSSKEFQITNLDKKKQEIKTSHSQSKKTPLAIGVKDPLASGRGRRNKGPDSEDSDVSPPRRKRLGSDSSPPRRQRPGESISSSPRRKRHDSDSSPQRAKRWDTDNSPPRMKRQQQDGNVSPSQKFIDVSQKGSGQRKEQKMSTKEYLAARKHGKLKKDTPEEAARKQREAALQQNAEEKHQQWKHGVKQVQDYKQKLADEEHERGKAFARTADDTDMNEQLKVIARKEDPMLEYMMKKETRTGNQSAKPVFKGPFPPNRLNIRPGYRWDGVDRSNGFEKRWFEHQNNKKAHAEDAYKWSVSDM